MFSLIVILFIIINYSNIIKEIDSKEQILVNETAVHLKIFNNKPILWSEYSVQTFRIKVSAIDLSNGTDVNDILISVMNDKNHDFVKQEKFGHLYNKNEFLLFSTNVTNIENITYLIEFFDEKNNEKFGFTNVLPFDYNNISDGSFRSPIYSLNNQLIGRITVEFLIIRPIHLFNPKVENTLHIKSGVYMGHRGTGVGRRNDLNEKILENTIEAFNYACNHGADMIELDVQLSQDKIPVIIHDFSAKVYLRKKADHKYDAISVPIKDLTFKQLTEVSTVANPVFDANSSSNNQPFETLENVFKNVKTDCGINVEIKYPQKKMDGSMTGVKGLELNQYVDSILKVMYENIGTRKAFITSFHPDLCAMIKLKQNLFEVALLTSGDVVKWHPNAVPHWDPRGTTIQYGTYFAQSMKLKGLSIYAKDLLENKSLINFVKSRNQSVYVWGDLLNSSTVIESLMKEGADGLIYDKIDKILH